VRGKAVAFVLSGCGYLDGAEIHEAVLTLLSLDRRGAAVRTYAPDRAQAHVVDHRTGEVTGETRNVLTESARIVRGKIEPLSQLRVEDADALIFPGGYGAAKNLGTFAFDGPDMRIDPDVERVIAAFRAAGKPIGFICIAPTLAAKAIPGVRVTVGCEGDAPRGLRAMGGQHVETTVDRIVVDDTNNVVSTAAYMLGPWIGAVADGIDALVGEVLRRA
jgi:enhancing lycopene biosynthesis protein 2